MKAAIARQSFSMAFRTFLAALPFLLRSAATRASTAATTSGQLWSRKIARFGLASINLTYGGKKGKAEQQRGEMQDELKGIKLATVVGMGAVV